MYSNTPKARIWESDNHRANSSSIATSRASLFHFFFQRPHNAFHASAPRAFDQNVGGLKHNQAVRSEEHTSELQSLMRISYAVFCLKKKKTQINMNKEYIIDLTSKQST